MADEDMLDLVFSMSDAVKLILERMGEEESASGTTPRGTGG